MLQQCYDPSVATYRALTTLQWASGLPQDVTVNTSYWIAPGSLNDFSEIADRLINFYDGWSQYMAGIIPTSGHTIRLYNMADAEPRVIQYEEPFTLPGASATGGLPCELAVCLSYAADPFSGIPPSSRRGRMYLGPFDTTALAAGTASAPATVNTSMLGTIAAEAALLQVPLNEEDVVWAQYSDKLGLTNPVTSAWLDNEWDIQRRRGVEATSRTTVSL